MSASPYANYLNLQPRRGCIPGSDGCTPPRRPKDATPEAECRRDLAVGERSVTHGKRSPLKMHPHRMRILQPQRRCFIIRVLYGRRKVGDDGYPGLRFAYPGLYASPVGSASHASHVIAIVSGIGNTPIHLRQPLMHTRHRSVILTAARLQLQ